MSKYEAVYFVGDNQAINRVRVDSSKTRYRGAFSGSVAALFKTKKKVKKKKKSKKVNKVFKINWHKIGYKIWGAILHITWRYDKHF